MKDEVFKIEVLRLLNKISDQLDSVADVVPPKPQKKKSIGQNVGQGIEGNVHK